MESSSENSFQIYIFLFLKNVLCNNLIFIFLFFFLISQRALNPQAERAALTEELAALRKKKEQLKAEIDKYRECDPDVVEEMRKSILFEVNFCMENVFTFLA